MKLLSSAVLILVVLAFVACAPAAEEVTLEEGLTVEEAVVEINRIVDQFDAAMNADDADALAMLYAENAALMMPDMPAYVGNAAIRDGFAETIAERASGQPGSRSVDNVVEMVTVAGDSIVVRGSFTVTSTPEGGGEPTLYTGKWMSLNQRQLDGTWKIIWDIWNRDAPPAEQ